MLLIGPLRTNFSEILFESHTLSFKKMHFKMSSAKMLIFQGPQCVKASWWMSFRWKENDNSSETTIQLLTCELNYTPRVVWYSFFNLCSSFNTHPVSKWWKCPLCNALMLTAMFCWICKYSLWTMIETTKRYFWHGNIFTDEPDKHVETQDSHYRDDATPVFFKRDLYCGNFDTSVLYLRSSS